MKHDSIKEIFSKNAVAISIYFLGVAFAGFNVYVASKLAPIVEDIAVIAVRVQALESKDSVTHAELKVIENRLDRIENKLDQLLLR
jgi:hypothetical protein